ncbi:hypothetical protein PR048_006932 [Dryococelus australis]|uniref:Uncharacterized protein n=1 Tax=Dryococelus australis TaxID=614101 RepID=A0ABQ9ICA9_9NEOP|nr:hypothetical protein PR048_006932 [Dryococelus australis]
MLLDSNHNETFWDIPQYPGQQSNYKEGMRRKILAQYMADNKYLKTSSMREEREGEPIRGRQQLENSDVEHSETTISVQGTDAKLVMEKQSTPAIQSDIQQYTPRVTISRGQIQSQMQAYIKPILEMIDELKDSNASLEQVLSEVRTNINEVRTNSAALVQSMTGVKINTATLEYSIGETRQTENMEKEPSAGTTMPKNNETTALTQQNTEASNVSLQPEQHTQCNFSHTHKGDICNPQHIRLCNTAATIQHPAQYWSKDSPVYNGKSPETPVAFLRQLGYYCYYSTVTESDIMKCLGTSCKATVYYWLEVNKHKFINYAEFKQTFIAHFWSMQTQITFRTQLKAEEYEPKRRRLIEEHLSVMYERTRNLEPQMSDTIISLAPTNVQWTTYPVNMQATMLSEEIWVALNNEVLTAYDGEVRLVWSSTGMKVCNIAGLNYDHAAGKFLLVVAGANAPKGRLCVLPNSFGLERMDGVYIMSDCDKISTAVVSQRVYRKRAGTFKCSADGNEDHVCEAKIAEQFREPKSTARRRRGKRQPDICIASWPEWSGCFLHIGRPMVGLLPRYCDYNIAISPYRSATRDTVDKTRQRANSVASLWWLLIVRETGNPRETRRPATLRSSELPIYLCWASENALGRGEIYCSAPRDGLLGSSGTFPPCVSIFACPSLPTQPDCEVRTCHVTRNLMRSPPCVLEPYYPAASKIRLLPICHLLRSSRWPSCSRQSLTVPAKLPLLFRGRPHTLLSGGDYGAVPECKGGETEDPRENPPTSGIVRHDSHIFLKLGVTRSGIESCSLWWETSRLTAQPPRPLSGKEHSLVTPEFSHVGIVPDDAAGRLGFLEVLPSPPAFPCLILLHSHLASPSSALETSLFRVARISSLTIPG